MSLDIRLPNITGKTDTEQLAQIKSYLYQFAEQLQWALKTVESGSSTSIVVRNTSGVTKDTPKDSASFNELKSLIIKTADVVKVYEEKVDDLLNLDGQYYASSPFGDFIEDTNNTVSANSKKISQELVSKQTIYDTDGNVLGEIISDGHIYSGIIEYAPTGEAIIGIEIGQTTTENGTDRFRQFARFTSEKLSFYDANSTEVAHISDYKLVITNAEIKGNLTLGGFLLDTSNGGIAIRWVGRS